MSKKICAITVSKNYLDGRKWSIKYLMIGKRKTEIPFWFVRHIGETGVDKVELTGTALQYAFKNNIPYFVNVRHGECVTTYQKNRLRKYGVTV